MRADALVLLLERRGIIYRELLIAHLSVLKFEPISKELGLNRELEDS